MKILFCECEHYNLVDQERKKAVRSLLAESGMDIVCVGDLCGLAAKQASVLKKISSAGELLVVACFPRAVKALFEFAGSKIPRLHLINMRTDGVEATARKLKMLALGKRSKGAVTKKISARKGWIPWFPVIDHDLCVNCGKCMDFCLFGTYSLSADGKIFVAKPENCKTNCPACAKICPKSAIIFPKHPEPPINGGKAKAGGAGASSMKMDYAKMLGDDAYAVLRRRSLDTVKSPGKKGEVKHGRRLLKRSL